MNTQIIHAVSATEIGDYKLGIAFDDGTMQEIDFKPFLASALHPDIRSYLDPLRFSSFRIEYGDLVWGDYDFCFPIFDLYKNQLVKSSSLEQAA
jgi:hypothetical protein